MKKLSMLIAMILCLTIGGVYAAWTYTNPAADITDKGLDTVIGVSLPAADQVGAVGEFSVSTNVTAISIDQAGLNDDGDDFHRAMLNYAVNDENAPYIEFGLKIVVNADADAIANLTTTYTIAITGAGQYNSKDIFVDLKPGATTIKPSATEGTDVKWTKVNEDDNYTYYTYKVLLADEVALNDAGVGNEIVLASKAQHTAFAAALGTPILDVKISDGVGA